MPLLRYKFYCKLFSCVNILGLEDVCPDWLILPENGISDMTSDEGRDEGQGDEIDEAVDQQGTTFYIFSLII